MNLQMEREEKRNGSIRAVKRDKDPSKSVAEQDRERKDQKMERVKER